MTQTQKIAEAVGSQTVACECGTITGTRCDWTGHEDETVEVEWMPIHLRASHKAAGNAGIWPHNGSVRLSLEASCAYELLEEAEEADGDWDWLTIVG